MPGYNNNANAVNQAAGLAVANLAAALDAVVAFNAMLLNAQRFNGEAGLVANQGFSTTDAGLIVASFSDLSNLASIAVGAAGYLAQVPGQSSPGANNFFFNAQQLMGTIPQ